MDFRERVLRLAKDADSAGRRDLANLLYAAGAEVDSDGRLTNVWSPMIRGPLDEFLAQAPRGWSMAASLPAPADFDPDAFHSAMEAMS